MALNLFLTRGAPSAGSSGASGAPSIGIIIVQNPGAAAVQLTSLVVSEITESDAVMSQPNIMTANAPYGSAFPTIAAGGLAYFPVAIVVSNPYGPGPSPQQPGGAYGISAQPADAFFTFQAIATDSTGAVSSANLQIGTLTALPLYPSSGGGSYVFSSGFNLINGLTLGTV